MNKKWRVAGSLLVVVALGTGAAFFSGTLPGVTGRGGEGADGDAKEVVPLEFQPREVVQPQWATLPGRVAFSGPLVAPGTAVLRAKAGGTLVALAVSEGDRVRAGQPLGRIDLADFDSRVAEREAMVAAARATLAQAERTLAQDERLAAQRFLSPAAVDTSRAAVETARAQLAAATAAVQTARVSWRDASLVAPIAGIVATRHVLPGEKVSPEQEVLTIVDLSRLELDGSVGTHEVAQLAPGMAVTVQVEGVERAVAGRIARIAPAAQPGTRSIGVTIELANADERLRAGQYAVATAVLPDETPRLTVPATAVGQTSGQDHVWLIESGTLARRAITVGRRDALTGRVEVLDGLPADSTVLAARFENLREGAKALVVADKASAVASSAASGPLK